MTHSGKNHPVMARLLAAASLVAMLAPLPSSAATVTIDDKGSCPSWTWDPGTRTLSCAAGTGGGSPPTCAAISGPTSGTVGTPITLTANCPGAASWTWTGGNCTGVTTSSCSAVSGTAGSVFYMVTGTNLNGTGGPAGFTVNWSGTPTFTCSFSPAPGAATVGAPLGLTVACSNGTPASFAWSATPPGGCQSGCTASWSSPTPTTAGSNSATLGAAGIWTLTATVTSTTGAVSPAQASVQASASTGGGAISCVAQGFSKTLVANWDWAAVSNPTYDTWNMQATEGGSGLGTNGILVVAFTPTGPSNLDLPTSGDNRAGISAIGYVPMPNQGNVMTLAISTQPCDLSTPDPGSSSSYSPLVSYGVGTPALDGLTGKPQVLGLTPGQPYYINIAGRSGALQTCNPSAIGSCELRLQVSKPVGH